jgi:hypothetical protein
MTARKVPEAFNKEWSGEDGQELKPYQKIFANQLARTMVKERLQKLGGAAVGCALAIVATAGQLLVFGTSAMLLHLLAASAVLLLLLFAFGRYAQRFYALRDVGNKYDKEWEHTVREIPQPMETFKVAAPMVDLAKIAGVSPEPASAPESQKAS